MFSNYTKLSSYDILLLQCEGENSPTAALKDASALNMRRYADNGGRVFAQHVHAYWIRKGLAPWPSVATWATSTTDLNSITGLIDTSFPKGVALSEWLVRVGASTTAGQIPLELAQHTVDMPLDPAAQRWIYTSTPTASVQYFTFNTPVEAATANQCGRMVFTDVHMGGGSSSHPDVAFPNGCAASLDMSNQEKALEFMFFDLSSCVEVRPGGPMAPPDPRPGTPMPPPMSVPAPPAPPPPPPPPPPPIIP
jgi:hypothetical protein